MIAKLSLAKSNDIEFGKNGPVLCPCGKEFLSNVRISLHHPYELHKSFLKAVMDSEIPNEWCTHNKTLTKIAKILSMKDGVLHFLKFE